jgi:redox-sensitive bicupin YhaK (pirin superfamily)
MKRRLVRVLTPKPQQGFLGPGHIAKAVIAENYSDTDPFILLMDDFLEVPEGEPVGSPHPHAGFETVTLILDGKFGGDEHGGQAGDFQLMTAGSGVVHTESIDPGTRMHILQMWLTLPKRERWAKPRMQILPFEHVPKVKETGKEIRVYCGQFAGVTSPVLNYVPLIIADIQLKSGVSAFHQLPADFNAFLYAIDGSILVGEEKKHLRTGDVGWLDLRREGGKSEIELIGGEEGGRVILYAGLPQHDQIVSHGPFIGDTREDISRLIKEYQQGKMKHINSVPQEQQVTY